MSYSRRALRCSLRRGIVLALAAVGILETARASEPVRITVDGTLKLAPVFVGDGAEVAFATHEQANLVSIIRLRLSDGTRRREHPTVTSHQFDPAYSRDGRFHAYAMSSNVPQMVLVIQDHRGKKEAVYRPRESRATARNPSIAPDGSRVVFSLSDVGGHQIASVEPHGQDPKTLTSSAGMNAWPRFAPDGRQIVFGSSRNGDFELYLMDPDGANLRRLTRSPGLDVRPAWSPDGSRIAFTSNRDGNYEIYVMKRDGSDVRNVTSHPSRDDHPSWHPDGQRIVFVSDRDGGSDLYVIHVP
jgi:TolB protein